VLFPPVLDLSPGLAEALEHPVQIVHDVVDHHRLGAGAEVGRVAGEQGPHRRLSGSSVRDKSLAGRWPRRRPQRAWARADLCEAAWVTKARGSSGRPFSFCAWGLRSSAEAGPETFAEGSGGGTRLRPVTWGCQPPRRTARRWRCPRPPDEQLAVGGLALATSSTSFSFPFVATFTHLAGGLPPEQGRHGSGCQLLLDGARVHSAAPAPAGQAPRRAGRTATTMLHGRGRVVVGLRSNHRLVGEVPSHRQDGSPTWWPERSTRSGRGPCRWRWS
jgi:hypothetical protein